MQTAHHRSLGLYTGYFAAKRTFGRQIAIDRPQSTVRCVRACHAAKRNFEQQIVLYRAQSSDRWLVRACYVATTTCHLAKMTFWAVACPRQTSRRLSFFSYMSRGGRKQPFWGSRLSFTGHENTDWFCDFEQHVILHKQTTGHGSFCLYMW